MVFLPSWRAMKSSGRLSNIRVARRRRCLIFVVVVVVVIIGGGGQHCRQLPKTAISYIHILH